MHTLIDILKKFALIVTFVICVLSVFVYFLPPVRTQAESRINLWQAQVKYALNPPEEVEFVPQGGQDQVALMVTATLRALSISSPTQTPKPIIPTVTQQGPTPVPTSTSFPTFTPTPLPEAVMLENIEYQHQHGLWNYCGPANLAMAVSFWGWQTDRLNTGSYLRGGRARVDDKNVMPYEMANYVHDETGLRMLVRTGGEMHLLKQLIASSFPVIIEKDDFIEGVDWLGHYLFLVGYDDAKGEFASMDTYHGAGTRYSYEFIQRSWRAFNYTFLVTYPLEQEEALFAILSPWVDKTWATRHALEIATNEATTLSGRDQFFAWFNLGTSRVQLLEYVDAALAFDTAFGIYADLPVDKQRPWRMMWYQTGPYWAYYYSGRYQDVVNLANTTLGVMKEPILEESFYWRGLGKEALGDVEGAIDDLEESVRLNPNFTPGWDQLARVQGGG